MFMNMRQEDKDLINNMDTKWGSTLALYLHYKLNPLVQAKKSSESNMLKTWFSFLLVTTKNLVVMVIIELCNDRWKDRENRYLLKYSYMF